MSIIFPLDRAKLLRRAVVTEVTVDDRGCHTNPVKDWSEMRSGCEDKIVRCVRAMHRSAWLIWQPNAHLCDGLATRNEALVSSSTRYAAFPVRRWADELFDQHPTADRQRNFATWIHRGVPIQLPRRRRGKCFVRVGESIAKISIGVPDPPSE